MNERIQRLRKELTEQKPYVDGERCKIFTESMKTTDGLPIIIRRAKSFYEVLDKMTVWVKPGELIVGNMAKNAKSSPVFPEYSAQWILEELDGKPYRWEDRPGDKFYILPEDEKIVRECAEYWNGKTLYDYVRKNLPKEVNDAWDAGVTDETWVCAAGLGNEIVDYKMVVEKGLKDVLTRIQEKKDSIDILDPDALKQLHFLEAAKLGNEAVLNYSNRLADKCEEEAGKTDDPEYKKELMELAEICRYVPFHPARTFQEAVQSIFMVLLAVHMESNGHAISLGRFDQYVYPLYKKDIEEGRITKEKALEIIECFFIKCNELNKLRSWPDTEFFMGYQMFINLAICGQTVEGKDATNDISRMCIQACRELKLITPSVSVKCFDGTTDEVLMDALEATIEHKGGMPAFYNDKAFIKILREMGVAEEDLVDWCPDGCIEASIPGKWDFAAKGPWLSIEKVLEITLNNGKDPATGTVFRKPDKDIVASSSMEDIFEEYKKTLKYFLDLNCLTEHINDEVHVRYDLNAFRSSLVQDCIGRCLDLVEGGALYSADGGPTAGTISAGDALTGIEYLVFDKKILTMEQLLHACATNFEDESTTPTGKEIQMIMKNKVPKFGNDDDYADKWVVAIEEYVGHSLNHDYKSSKYGKGPVPCCFAYSQTPVTGNISFGSRIGATPDGRSAGEPVNNGVSPANGSERNGATAACNSVAKIPTIYDQKGNIFNMRLAPSTIANQESRQKILDMMRALFDKDAEQIQFNVVDNEVLKEAQKRPEDFPDLMVRVSGYSALFTSLGVACQNDVINRTEVEM
ncbi:pyruvate formate-lyase [Dorea formicigenerans]|uniref:Pyruvate formate-lyase n=1 Tax=Dorea formicigenerans TaxID=39486 RepID=A0A3E4F8H5_9FIRM|nr:pyruvate formate lyase family protein [Dorea formicigenerans]RGI85736.1 pyruvate formate-lyase [Dorea formicigenerans]RGI88917.1 pyruvate formate-lyase [Dorea formicigenerans]